MEQKKRKVNIKEQIKEQIKDTDHQETQEPTLDNNKLKELSNNN
jgi:hypothetical protein